MKLLTAVAAVFLGLGLASGASAGEPGTKVGETEFGSTLPPIGFVRYCLENKSACQRWVSSGEAVELTPDNWNTLFRVNTMVNNKIAPVSDMYLYGEVERWVIPNHAGDCEDYALLKQNYLQSLGFPADSLRLTVVLDEQNEGHAVLTVVTRSGDFVLDNRQNDIRRANDTKYTFLKRQSRDNPRAWVALSTQPTRSSGVVATQNDEAKQ